MYKLKDLGKIFADMLDDNMLANSLKSREELAKDTEDFENRKCFCILRNGSLACARRITGEIFKVGDDYSMTDKQLVGAKMKRWATGFDV